MKAIELRKKSRDELEILLRETLLRREEAAFSIRQKKTKNVKALAALRRDVARIRTLIKETVTP
ncbi:MAG: 50S ribosomal protein L29 [Patescibacteria group bacterium]